MLDKRKWYKGKMHHYTDVNAVEKILKDEISFYFTHEGYLNDPEEGKNIEKVFNKVLKELLDGDELNNDQKELMKKFELKRHEYYYSTARTENEDIVDLVIEIKKQEAFICCFSKLRDSLPMWNYYNKDNSGEGYSLEFDTGLFSGEWSEESVGRSNAQGVLDKLFNEYGLASAISEVIYDDKEKAKIIKDMILCCVKDYDKTKEKEDEIKYDNINDQISKYRYLFKPEYFKHEEEVRVIIKRDINTSKRNAIETKYRTNAGYFIPYLEIEIDNAKQYLTSVTIGPKSNKEIAEFTLQMFLADNGYGGVKIHSSNIKLGVFG